MKFMYFLLRHVMHCHHNCDRRLLWFRCILLTCHMPPVLTTEGFWDTWSRCMCPVSTLDLSGLHFKDLFRHAVPLDNSTFIINFPAKNKQTKEKTLTGVFSIVQNLFLKVSVPKSRRTFTYWMRFVLIINSSYGKPFTSSQPSMY